MEADPTRPSAPNDSGGLGAGPDREPIDVQDRNLYRRGASRFPVPDPDTPPSDGGEAEAASPSSAVSDFTTEVGQDPSPPEDEDLDGQPSSEEQARARERRTMAAVGGAIVVTLATISLARSILPPGVEVGLGATIAVGAVGFVVALAGLIPYRWGLWVVPFVTLAHYGLNFYNMLFAEGSLYDFVSGDAMGYAVLTPAIGVVIGWILEGVYRAVSP